MSPAGRPARRSTSSAALRSAPEASAGLRKAAEDVLRRAGRPAGDMSALTSRLNETMVHLGLLSSSTLAGWEPWRSTRSIRSAALRLPVDVGRSRAVRRAAPRPPRASAAPTAGKAAAPKPPPPKVERVDERPSGRRGGRPSCWSEQQSQAADLTAGADAHRRRGQGGRAPTPRPR